MMNLLLRGCLTAACVLVALLGFGVGLCGLILSAGGHGLGLLFLGALMVVGPVIGIIAIWRTADSSPVVMKIAAYRSGRVTVDGVATEPAQLAMTLARLRHRNGVVWLYREGNESERHPNALLVARAIADARLPLSLSSRPDFTDELQADGTARPR
jgi:hypothetical protein